MTISVWRYSHLALAISSFLFILVASLTGVILAFEPISQKIQPYKSANFSTISVSKLVKVLKENNSEILDISVDKNNFVIVKAIDNNGKDETFYANPENGKKIAEFKKKNDFFQFVTNLHRSLFLHEFGRIIIGITSFILLLISISGTILLIQRQRGFKYFFSKIVKENFAQYYHIVLGRLTLIPIIIISFSGVYLSLVKFNLFKDEKVVHKINYEIIKSEPKLAVIDFPIFKNIPISEVQKIEFPFSDDVEDYFTLTLNDKEIVVNQYTGEVLSEVLFSKTKILNDLSLDLHTGQASGIWAFILAIASINILFFIYSGFTITLKRTKNTIKNKFKKEDCEFIILIGSENGSTFKFAKVVQNQLLRLGNKSFICELNNFSVFPKAKHFIVMTATYGLGEAPTNATKFLNLIKQFPQPNTVNFSVLAFGSKSYPEFCKFGYDVFNALSSEKWANLFLEIHTVNDKSPADFMNWYTIWSHKNDFPLAELPNDIYKTNLKFEQFTVVSKTKVAYEDGSFLIQLASNKSSKFTSGDLLSIFPANDYRERLYSIGKIDDKIQLSVKLHPNGLGSSFLYNLEKDAIIEGSIFKNSNFHLPKKAKRIIMISNGTGISPFLGMIDQNYSLKEICLYCGFRGESSFKMYSDSIQKYQLQNKLTKLNVAYSREGEKMYVKDLVTRDSDFITKILIDKGVIMICGSLAMQQMVLEVLEHICKKNSMKSVSYFQARKQILMDCY